MSRLIIKNLPKNVTEAKLKEHFGKKGTITDVQLKYTKDGIFRRFCFVGYKTEEEAQKAVEYFNETYVDTSKISVELCAKLGDSSKPKSWSKYAVDSSTNKKLADEKVKKAEVSGKKEKKKEKEKKNNELKKVIDKHKDDPLFKEFLESHCNNSTKQLWSNEIQTLLNTSKESSESENESDENDSKETEEKESEKKLDFEEFKKLKNAKENKKQAVKYFTVKVRGLGCNHKKKDLKQFFKPLKPKSIRVPQKIKGIAYVGFKTEKHMTQALSKHKSFLDGKQIFVAKYEQKDDQEGGNQNKSEDIRWKKQTDALVNEESIAESGRMFLRNLSYTTTEDDVTKLFEKYGNLTEVNLPIDKISRKPKGFGTVTFMMPEHAVKAYTELDGSILNGRMLHILPGKAKASLDDLLNNENLSYKEKKELKEKATAGSSHNWNSLFLGTDAVAEAMAASYNTTKEKILEDNSKGISTAVRLALGETQLVEKTKKFLEENGVCLDAFNQPPQKRSKTVILVKNLPAQTRQEEILEMFSKHGEVGRIVMPPAGITAIIEFFEPSEARKAFTKLAYTKFKNLPLYLEWAPDNSFMSEKTSQKIENSSEKSQKGDKSQKKEDVKEEIGTNNQIEKKEEEEDDEDDDDDEPEPDTTLFVKNINFSTTDEEFKKHFSRCGTLHYATIATKQDPNNPSMKLSMGYGFVRYKYKVHADRALKELQMTNLNGKTLELKRSERTLQSDLQANKKKTKMTPQTGTKILVRNIPFQANANEVTQLFKVFGDLKAVRLPKKLVGDEKHRGFAFVEYSTKKDAKVAFKALCQSTHLYGRRLVLEWAQKEEGIDEIRKRTAKHFHEEKSGKRSKKGSVDPESFGLDEKIEDE